MSISNRFTRILGVDIVEDFDGENLFENFPAYLAFSFLALSVILSTMSLPLYILIPEIVVRIIFS